MLKNYLKVILRSIIKQKGYFFINIAGMGLGIACCLLISIYVVNELSYDKFYKDSDKVFRVAVDMQKGESKYSWAATPEPLGPAIAENCAQAVSVSRIHEMGKTIIKNDDKIFYENRCVVADPQIFEVLPVAFIEGNHESALAEPGSIVVTEKFAQKYFESQDVVGKTIQINNNDYKITGLIANLPRNTHFKYNAIISFNTFEPSENFNNWLRMSMYTYVKISPNASFTELEKDINRYLTANVSGKPVARNNIITASLQPITDIHLYSNLFGEYESPGSLTNIIVFSIIGILILCIACFNFINLSTARSFTRNKEIGIRKVVGAKRYQLFMQFMSETIIYSIMAFILAFLLLELGASYFNELAGLNYSFSSMIASEILLWAFGLLLFVGFLAGSFPAILFSAIKPSSFLKGSFFHGARGNLLRKVLVVGQFSISIILIVGTLIVFNQLDYMKDQPLGFNPENKIIIPLGGEISITNNYESIKNELISSPLITGVTMSSSIPGRIYKMHVFRAAEESESKQYDLYHLYIDRDFILEYDINLLAGRTFDKTVGSNSIHPAIVNMETVKLFGWTSAEIAVGKPLLFGDEKYEIIGVVDNFHYHGLQNAVQPLIIDFETDRFHNITITHNTDESNEVLSFIENKWKEFFTGNPFEYYFLDSDFDRLYRSEERIGNIITGFALLAISISCLGLFGLVSFIAVKRYKEIGIRKILGASIFNIIKMLTKELVILVGMANIIAWPIAYYAMNKWLESFAFRTEINISVFLIAGFFALVIAILTVSYQAIKAAFANPINAIQHE